MSLSEARRRKWQCRAELVVSNANGGYEWQERLVTAKKIGKQDGEARPRNAAEGPMPYARMRHTHSTSAVAARIAGVPDMNGNGITSRDNIRYRRWLRERRRHAGGVDNQTMFARGLARSAESATRPCEVLSCHVGMLQIAPGSAGVFSIAFNATQAFMRAARTARCQRRDVGRRALCGFLRVACYGCPRASILNWSREARPRLTPNNTAFSRMFMRRNMTDMRWRTNHAVPASDAQRLSPEDCACRCACVRCVQVCGAVRVCARRVCVCGKVCVREYNTPFMPSFHGSAI